MGFDPGLADVVAARTSVSHVDGDAGGLWLRGVPVGELARWGFGRAAAHVLGRPLQDPGGARTRAWARQDGRAVGSDPVPAVRSLIADAPDDDEALIAELAVAIGRVAAALAGRPALAPDPTLPHEVDLARMVLGRTPSDAEAHGLRAYLATVMDHGLNASTFTARVVASTGADRTSAVVAALGALSGPLHGGAPGPVLDMLDAIGRPERADAWIAAELDAGRRIMGMGHRVYRVRDPRADVLFAALDPLPAERIALARAVESAATRALAARHPDRVLAANVELATAVLLDAVGVDRRLFTALFAAGRVVGWLAHVQEARADGRIVRPRSEYVGPPCAAG